MSDLDFDFKFRRAQASDLSVVEALLADAGLPIQDISRKLDSLWVATQVDLLVGVGGLEAYQPVGLIRSIATTERFRGKGFGKLITKHLLEQARREEIETVFLLTLTAAGFFRKLGFERVPREDVPNAIQRTTEFSELCPQSAVCMKLDLSD
ncbi:GNAT family N-acetyltransferase [bacterium]|nr:GNAT family N-acetyltransferase [bacterium]MCB2202149.1 GNAT family N-acetyltransferase [bacterium]